MNLLQKAVSQVVYHVFMVGLPILIYLNLAHSSLLEKQYPDVFSSQRSFAGSMLAGDIYGICTSVETIKKLNREVAPILETLVN